MNDVDLDRLLRSAAQMRDDVPTEAPFGLDTRIVALWRNNGNGATLGLTRLVRRVVLIAAAVVVVAAAGAYREASQNRETNELFANEFAIADSAIQDEFLQ